MLLKEIDKRLDMDCISRFNKDDRVFSLSKALGHTFQAFMEIKDDEKVLSVYVPKENLETPSAPVRYLISTTDVEGFLITRIPIEESIYELLAALDMLESTSTFDFTVEAGHLTVRFRLHHTALSHLSRILAKYDILEHLVKEMNIQPSNGFISQLDFKNKKFPLRVLEYSLPFSRVKGKDAKMLFEEGAIAELAAVFSNPVDHKLIFYAPKSSKTKLKPISPHSDIYETLMKDLEIEPFNILVNLFNSKGLKRFNVFFRKVDSTLRIVVLVERYDAMRHISETFTIYGKANVPIDVTLSTAYNETIWEMI
ncbi:MAG: hypothetical protein M1163_02655 [Candidatus Thermoplasmatota archaeon]|nr:hypothetical protein [Candidatus Thermoplasmatota archaeon]